MSSKEQLAVRKGVSEDRVKCGHCIHFRQTEYNDYCKTWETPDVDADYYCDWFSVGVAHERSSEKEL